ncbi:MAG: T9SS type A sorting domain-containing protein [Candidatus Marinimicrobia bacterium]|nr:T9SS type A sorting domain-containing protein [Candidatus Neomarinimicrobiota bacterium]MCF7827398.1 T9SS type A sorting domain-containing protein [Candidatus Neomarinimicrobiota bacterium]MCF7881369.1 T9SS type A sorting domain-containing protein [Candidatus Neomarinimicrobiota bacterium]
MLQRKNLVSAGFYGLMLELVLILIPAITLAQLPAFPGAQGFGSETTHGRDGEIIEVTNLNSSGSGSFRSALAASGKRIIVFRVSGIIDLGTNPIEITNPYLYVAGQTAPGDGICLRGAPLEIKTHNVVIRYIRSRPGDDPDDFNPGSRDGLNITNAAYNVVIDHCSFTWGLDENAGIWYNNASNPVHDVTIQWSLVAQGLHESIHPEGAHGTGLLVGDYSQNISIHHNLFAHNNQRNPLLKGGVKADIRNNVVYNWGGICIQLNDRDGTEQPTYANLVNNFFKGGPDSDNWEVRINRSGDEAVAAGSEIYVAGNIGPHRKSDSEDEWNIVQDSESGIRAETATEAPTVIQFEATEVVDYVLADAGAVRPNRDRVDADIVSQFRNGTGEIIDKVSDAGGYPDYQSATPPPDEDGDGMADSWETENGLNPSDGSDGAADRDGDGYTNVEEYLNMLAVQEGFLLPPTGLRKIHVDGNSVRLQWDEIINKESGFVVERSVDSASNYDEVGRVGENVTEFTDSGLEPITTYHYRVYGYKNSTTSDTATITITTLTADGRPVPVKAPEPQDEATDVPMLGTLAWNGGEGAESYDIYYGIETPPPFVKNVREKSLSPKLGFADTETYYWRVDAVNGSGTTEGPVWSFRTEIIPAEEVAAYSFDDLSSEFLKDESSGGKSHYAYLKNMDSVKSVTGAFGGAISLDGVDDFIGVLNNSDIRFRVEDFSISFWIKTNSTGTIQPLVSQNNEGGTGYSLHLTQNGGIAFSLNDGEGTSTVATGSGSVATGTWTHIVAMAHRHPDELRVYLDGELAATVPDTVGDISTGELYTKLGTNTDESVFVKGGMDEFSIFRYALSGEAVSNLYERNTTALDPSSSPEQYELSVRNYPNPFNPVTMIEYTVPNKAPVTVSVYTVTGKKVATLVNSRHRPGLYRVLFDGSPYGSGLYFYRITAGSQVQTEKMILVK